MKCAKEHWITAHEERNSIAAELAPLVGKLISDAEEEEPTPVSAFQEDPTPLSAFPEGDATPVGAIGK